MLDKLCILRQFCFVVLQERSECAAGRRSKIIKRPFKNELKGGSIEWHLLIKSTMLLSFFILGIQLRMRA